MNNKQIIAIVILIVAIAVSVTLLTSGPSKEELEQQYRDGFVAGKKAEQAKWSDEYLTEAKQAIQQQVDGQESIQALLNKNSDNIRPGKIEKKGSDRVLVWLEGTVEKKPYSWGYLEFKKVNDYWFITTAEKTATQKVAPESD